MTPTAVEQAARTLLDHRDRGLRNPLATSPAKVTDVDSGYAVQSASEAILSQERGLHPVGYNYYATLRKKLHWHEYPTEDNRL